MTEQPKWTPGPWALEIRPGSGAAADCTIAMIEQPDERAPYRGMIARLQSAEHIDGIAKDEMTANAHLIAAAPDLYAALEACVVSLERANTEEGVCCCGDSMDRHSDPMHCGHSPVDMGDYYAGQALEAARAALAKARGETK